MIPTPTEEGFFRQMGVPYWPPKHRAERRLMQFLADEATAPSH
jgi:DNA polymerase/3'-5' exonuclease PolX